MSPIHRPRASVPPPVPGGGQPHPPRLDGRLALAVSFYETLLLLHVLAAFLLVAGVVCYGVIVLAPGEDAARRALAMPALALWNIGGVGVLVLGIWLAIDADQYEVWDAWIVAAIVLWLVASAAGGPLSRGLREGPDALPVSRARALFAVAAVATAALLIDMIFKPGA